MHIGSIFQRAIIHLKSPKLSLHPGKEEALQEVEQGVEHIEGYVKAVDDYIPADSRVDSP